MTSRLTRIAVIGIVVYLLIEVSAASSLSRGFLDFFRNPVKDFVKSLPKEAETSTKSVTIPAYVSTEGSMISVPLNKRKCKKGTYRDLKGVCRETF